MAFDTTRLLAQIKLKGAIPEGRFTDQEILDVAYDVLISNITPFLVSNREDYYVMSETQAITASQASYSLPSRAIGQSLREVKMIRGNQVIDLERIDLEEVTSTIQGQPNQFYIENNELILYPTPQTTADTLKQYFFIRPSKLVPITESARITAIDTGTNTITTTDAPSGWTTADTFDLIQGKSGFRILSQDLTASSVATNSIVLSGIPSTLVVGDYINLVEETVFPYLPTEAHSLLVHATVAELLESIGDMNGFQAAEVRVARMMEVLESLFATRVQGAPKQLSTPLI